MVRNLARSGSAGPEEFYELFTRREVHAINHFTQTYGQEATMKPSTKDQAEGRFTFTK
jgi:hypothetical protein